MVGAEVNQAMCDAGAETLVMNGFGAKCLMINKDVRRLDVTAKPDGTPPDMQHKADMAVFEVCMPSMWMMHWDTSGFLKLSCSLSALMT